MSAIRQALAKLDGAVGKLEASMTGLENATAGQQQDMFGGTVSPAVVSQKLDSAIQKVETLLKETA